MEIFLGSSIVAYSRSTGYLTLNHFYYADEGETMILTEGGGPLDISYFKGYEDQIDRFAYGYTSQVWGVSWTGSHIEIVLRPTLADDVMPLVRDPNSDFEYDLSVKPNLYIDGRSVGTVTYPLIYTGSGFTVGEPGIRITYTP